MRPWQEYLMNYAPAQADFLAWLAEIQQSLIKQIVEVSKSGDSAKLAPLAIELAVYEKILSSFRAEFRERQTQLERGK